MRSPTRTSSCAARQGPVSWGLCAVVAALLIPAGPVTAQAPAARRVAPPEQVQCPRDRLTLYAGKVTTYRREAGVTTLRIRTDWDTTETVTLRHPGTDDPSRWFLIDRAAFTPADWARIESAPGTLRPQMRAAAWVCSDGSPPLIDWQPPRAP